jgi:hypothetical protein
MMFPLLADVPVPCAAVTPWASREFATAMPEYSKMAKRNVLLESDSDMVTLFAPPLMFSA